MKEVKIFDDVKKFSGLVLMLASFGFAFLTADAYSCPHRDGKKTTQAEEGSTEESSS